jgi:hypothetical protein
VFGRADSATAGARSAGTSPRVFLAAPPGGGAKRSGMIAGGPAHRKPGVPFGRKAPSLAAAGRVGLPPSFQEGARETARLARRCRGDRRLRHANLSARPFDRRPLRPVRAVRAMSADLPDLRIRADRSGVAARADRAGQSLGDGLAGSDPGWRTPSRPVPRLPPLRDGLPGRGPLWCASHRRTNPAAAASPGRPTAAGSRMAQRSSCCAGSPAPGLSTGVAAAAGQIATAAKTAGCGDALRSCRRRGARHSRRHRHSDSVRRLCRRRL